MTSCGSRSRLRTRPLLTPTKERGNFMEWKARQSKQTPRQNKEGEEGVKLYSASPPLSVGVCSTSLAFCVLSGTPESGHWVQFSHRKHPVEARLRLARHLCRIWISGLRRVSVSVQAGRRRSGHSNTHQYTAWHIISSGCHGAASKTMNFKVFSLSVNSSCILYLQHSLWYTTAS